MLDHVFLSVSDIERSIAFYAQALASLGITDRVDYDGKDGPPGILISRASAARGASSSGCG
jgi:catechol 2,3-dioxygenase-like lactoylglutathione lyase family enzyme